MPYFASMTEKIKLLSALAEDIDAAINIRPQHLSSALLPFNCTFIAGSAMAQW